MNWSVRNNLSTTQPAPKKKGKPRRWTAKAALARTRRRMRAIENHLQAISVDWAHDDNGICIAVENAIDGELETIMESAQENCSPEIKRDRGGERIYEDF
jgi:hypothetical protein